MLPFLAIYLRYNEVINDKAWLSSWLMNYMQRGRPSTELPAIIKHLLIINLLVFASTLLFGKTAVLTQLGAFFPAGPYFKMWQPLTHMFLHIDVWHIAFNMFGLWMFGTPLARKWGWQRFLVFYILCGLGGYALMQGVNYFQYLQDIPNFNINTVGLGASGAIYGLLVAFAYLFPNTELMLLFLPIPIKAKYFVPGLILIDLFFGFAPINTGFAHFAHVGGALVGFLLVLQMQKNRKNFY